jgi:hypothetical protein
MASPGQPSARWRKFVDERPIASLILVGFIATQLGTYFGYVFPAIGLPTLPWPMYNGALAQGIAGPNWGTYFTDGGGATGLFFSGLALHLVNGVVFAVLYGVIARHSLPFSGKTNGGNISKGLLYGVIMTIISAGILVPYAYVPHSGYGFFLFDGPNGWKLPAGILLWHLIYGYFLGQLYQPSDED